MRSQGNSFSVQLPAQFSVLHNADDSMIQHLHKTDPPPNLYPTLTVQDSSGTSQSEVTSSENDIIDRNIDK